VDRAIDVGDEVVASIGAVGVLNPIDPELPVVFALGTPEDVNRIDISTGDQRTRLVVVSSE